MNADLLFQGSGKTFTMGLAPRGAVQEDKDLGVTPRVLGQIFAVPPTAVVTLTALQHRVEGVECRVQMSFLEIYREQVVDLLQPPGGQVPEIAIREDKQKQVSITGLLEERIQSEADAMACAETIISCSLYRPSLLERGLLNRTTGSTDVHQHSSRSHAILTLTLEQTATQPDGSQIIKSSRLCLVDLAGKRSIDRYDLLYYF
jgi:hypothetical protein